MPYIPPFTIRIIKFTREENVVDEKIYGESVMRGILELQFSLH